MSRKRHIEYDIHHRLPTSRGGKNNPENLSRVPVNQHRAWHTVFRNESAQEIAKRINDTWLDPAYYLVAIPRKRKQGEKHKHQLQIVCTECGGRCEMKDVPVRILKKLPK